MSGSRAVIRAVSENACTITVQGTTRTFWAPQGGGYVREVTATRPGTLGQQVLDATAREYGTTLYWGGRGSLADVMRRQRRAERARATREGWCS